MMDREVTKVAVTFTCSYAFLFVVYNLVEYVRGNDGLLFSTSSRKKKAWEQRKKEADLLFRHFERLDNRSFDRSRLIAVLSALTEFTTCSDFQDQILRLGYLPKIINLLDHPDNDVKEKVALVINDLALSDANQDEVQKCIPRLIGALSTKNMCRCSIGMFIAVLCALINITTLKESHSHVLPYAHVLYQLLQQCDVTRVKLQVLTILVNLSTNKKTCENMLEHDAQLLRCMETYIGHGVGEAFVLRAVTCCANVLSSLQRRWRYGNEPTVIATPEFVSDRVQDELLKLSLHENEVIRGQARRCVAALYSPPTPTASGHSMDSLDTLDVLKL